MTLPQDIASKAEKIVESLKQTDYQHIDHIVVANGIYDCDCNGFVAFVLSSVRVPLNTIISSRRSPRNHRAAGIGSIFLKTPAEAISSRGAFRRSSHMRTPVMS
jgi:hypothetical protein